MHRPPNSPIANFLLDFALYFDSIDRCTINGKYSAVLTGDFNINVFVCKIFILKSPVSTAEYIAFVVQRSVMSKYKAKSKRNFAIGLLGGLYITKKKVTSS